MGILNVTPDSFSDGGRHLDPGVAVEGGVALVAAGADVVDVGGESTRPGAAEVPEGEELRRVLPVIRGLAAAGVTVSVDTRRAAVAARALDAGARMVNDVRGGADPGMIPLVASARCGYIAMHSRGTPATMAGENQYDDVVAEVWAALYATRDRCRAAGVADGELWLDPGLGFAKDTSQNLAILADLPRRPVGRVVIGASRKRFLGALTRAAGATPAGPADRLEGSLAVALWCAQAGVGMIRVHDVGATVRALRVWAAVAGAP